MNKINGSQNKSWENESCEGSCINVKYGTILLPVDFRPLVSLEN